MLLLNYVKLDVPGSGLSHSIILSTYYILQICWMQSFGTVCVMVTGSFVSLNRKVIEVLLISGLAYTGPWVKVETKDLSWSLGSWKSSKEGGSRKRPAGERPPPLPVEGKRWGVVQNYFLASGWDVARQEKRALWRVFVWLAARMNVALLNVSLSGW